MNNEKTQEIFIGVDGGGSGCRLCLENATGKFLGKGEAGSASIKFSVAQTWSSIMEAFRQALQEAELDVDLTDEYKNKKYCFHLGCGLAGCELPEACYNFLSSKPQIFSTLVLQSDAYTACLGAHDGRDGAIIAVGTGVTSMQIQAGKITKASGWGFPHGDEGGAAWLGLEVVRLTTQWLDGRYPIESPLLAALFSKFNNNQTELVVWANSKNTNAAAFAQLAPLVIDHAKGGDVNAVMLLQRAAAEIDKVAFALTKYAASEKPLPCCLLGGLASFIVPYLEASVRARLVARKHDAAYGAILMMKDRRGEYAYYIT